MKQKAFVLVSIVITLAVSMVLTRALLALHQTIVRLTSATHKALCTDQQ